jgi:hypothetical protein
MNSNIINNITNNTIYASYLIPDIDSKFIYNRLVKRNIDIISLEISLTNSVDAVWKRYVVSISINQYTEFSVNIDNNSNINVFISKIMDLFLENHTDTLLNLKISGDVELFKKCELIPEFAFSERRLTNIIRLSIVYLENIFSIFNIPRLKILNIHNITSKQLDYLLEISTKYNRIVLRSLICDNGEKLPIHNYLTCDYKLERDDMVVLL